MIAALSRPLAALAAIGWVASLAASVANLAGVTTMWGAAPVWTVNLLGSLMLGLGLAAIILLCWSANGHVLTPGLVIQTAFERSPSKVRYAFVVTVIYTIVAFATPLFYRMNVGGATSMGLVSVMFAYLLVLLSTTSISLRCAHGHRVGPFDQYCRACGDPIVENARA